jgi:hypothetical protein
MVMAARLRIVLVFSLLLLLPLLTGCIKFRADFTVKPDGATAGMMKLGMASQFSDKDAKNPFADLIQGPSGKLWKVRQYKDGDMDWAEAIGSAAPGQDLFGDAKGPALKVETAKRRLSTRYAITLTVPPPSAGPPAETPKPAAPPAGGDSPDMSKQVEAMTASLMASMQFDFCLTGPGRVIATTGQVNGPGSALWHAGGQAFKDQKFPAMTLVTDLINWEHVGRIAAQIVTSANMPDAGSRLADALQRDLLPNPALSNPASNLLSAVDYGQLLVIIARLDAAVRPELTARIIKQSGLSRDTVAPLDIKMAADRLAKADLVGATDSAAVNAALQVLGVR